MNLQTNPLIPPRMFERDAEIEEHQYVSDSGHFIPKNIESDRAKETGRFIAKNSDSESVNGTGCRSFIARNAGKLLIGCSAVILFFCAKELYTYLSYSDISCDCKEYEFRQAGTTLATYPLDCSMFDEAYQTCILAKPTF